MSEKSRFYGWLVGLWLAFTVALACWWMIFGLQQLNQIRALDHERAPELERKQTMLMMEGSILILSVLVGGATIFRYIRKERDRHQQIQDFFTAFTHDAKTSLASLRLQAESLQEDLSPAGKNNPIMDRLIQDTVRLQLQLENSLFLANMEKGSLHLESIAIERVVGTLRHHWPHVKIELEGNGKVRADLRALESVLGNLVQNAIVHGKATEVRLKTESSTAGRLFVVVEDNGIGFGGDFEKLGQLFWRPGKTSGTGIGLYLTRQLLQRMDGEINFEKAKGQGFKAKLSLAEAAA